MPCFCCAPRGALAKSRPLPLLRLACICRRQRLGCAARPPIAVPLPPAAAVLLRLANFPCGRRCALVKIGALRQLRLAASAAGSARLSCPLLGGSGPLTAPSAAAPPGGLLAENFAAHPVGIFEPTHPPTEVSPGLRPRPCRGSEPLTAPPGYRCPAPDGHSPVNGKRNQSMP